MPFQVRWDESNRAVILRHEGEVDEAEIEASRLAAAQEALRRGARNVVIDIVASEIRATPGEIITNVNAIGADLPEPASLAFVAREDEQERVALIVSTVAFNSGLRVGQFRALDPALCWLTHSAEEAEACGCMPRA